MTVPPAKPEPRLTGGVNYGELDPWKVICQRLARLTDGNVRRLGYEVIDWSRGESVVLFRDPKGQIIGHVEEGLGTKDLVAFSMIQQLGAISQAVSARTHRSYYDNLAQCTLAMIVNDMITLGVLPVSAAQHLAVGDSKWFNDKERAAELAEGWKKACDLARCTWGGGETPALKGLVNPEAPVMAGSSFGVAMMKNRTFLQRLCRFWQNGELAVDPKRIAHGDRIIFLHSSGVHANGLTLAREIGDNLKELPQGYMTPLSDGRPYGEALLDPTNIYVGFIEDAINAGVDIHYGVNITGHGIRKLMRPNQKFSYRVDCLPPVHPVFNFIMEHNPNGPMSLKEAYGSYNMGAGFAIYVPGKDVDKVMGMANSGKYPFGATLGGSIQRDVAKSVYIRPYNIRYQENELDLRG